MPSRRLNENDIKFFLKLANKNPDLSDWDIKFIESIELLIKNNPVLTEKQEEQLERIALGK